MRRVLKPGGTLVVGVWSGPKDQVVSVLEDGFGKHLGDSYVPIHAWSFGGLDRFKSLADDVGYLEKRAGQGIAGVANYRRCPLWGKQAYLSKAIACTAKPKCAGSAAAELTVRN